MNLKSLRFGASVVLFVLIIGLTSCATHNRHRKMHAVPCPCETRNRR